MKKTTTLVGRFLLFAILVSSNAQYGAEAQQNITFTGISLSLHESTTLEERMQIIGYVIESIVVTTMAGTSSIDGTNLWTLEAYLTTSVDTPERVVSGTSVNFDDGQSINAGEVLRFQRVEVNFDLSSITCASVNTLCVVINKGSNPNFYIINDGLMACQEIQCRGVIVQQVLPSIENRNSLKQGESNTLTISIALVVSANSSSVQGQSLTEVEVFGSPQPDGTGEKHLAVLTTAIFDYGITRGTTSTIPAIMATLDLQSVGCNQFSYVCVNVTRSPNPSPPYTLTFTPPEASVACKQLTCSSLEVIGGEFVTSYPLGEYKQRHTLNFQEITFYSSATGGSVAVSSGHLWALEVTVEDQNRDSIQETMVTVDVPAGQDGQAFIRGMDLRFTGVAAVLDLTMYECSEVGGLRVKLVKHSQSPVDFTIMDNVIKKTIECRGVTITDVNVSPSITPLNGFPLKELTPEQYVFDVTFGTDRRYGSVDGSSLWNIEAGFSGVASPNFDDLPATALANLRFNQKNLDVEGGDDLVFSQSVVQISYNAVCQAENQNYFCVKIGKEANPTVTNGNDFMLSGQSTGCTLVDCVGIQITNINVVSSVPLDLEEHSVNQLLVFLVEVESNADAGSARGDNIWDMTVFLSRSQELDLSTSGVVTDAITRSTDISAGVVSRFSVSATIEITVSCEDMLFVCFLMEQSDSAVALFTYDPDVNVRFGCTPRRDCRNVVIGSLSVSIMGSDVVTENTNSNQQLALAIVATPDPNSISMSETGSNYWQLAAFGSQSNAGTGDRIDERLVGLTFDQKDTPLIVGKTAMFNISYIFLTDFADCSRFQFICVELQRNGDIIGPYPDFTLREPFTGCESVNCKGVEIDETRVSVQTGGFREGAAVNDLTVDVQLIAADGSAGIAGTDLWSLRMFTNTLPNGANPTRLFSQVLQPAAPWKDADLLLSTQVRGTDLPGVNLNGIVDLSETLCEEVAYVCIIVSKGNGPSTAFTLEPISESSLTGCVSVGCDGFTIEPQSLDFIPPAGIVVEHSSDPAPISFSVSFMSHAENEDVTGSALWKLEVYLNGQQDGLGPKQGTERTVMDLLGAQNQDLAAGDVLSFNNVQVGIPQAQFVCPPQQAYLCVQLQKNPDRTFTLIVPDPICITIECRGVLVTSVSLGIIVGNPFVEFANKHDVTLSITLNTDTNWAGVTGERLWTYSVFLNPTNETSSIRYGEVQASYTIGSETVVAGTPLDSSINGLLDLSDVSCQDADFICVIVTKGAMPSVSFTFEQTRESSLRSCASINCQGVDLVSVQPMINLGVPFLEQSGAHVIVVFITLEFSTTTASLSGVDFWDVLLFTNTESDGTGILRRDEGTFLAQAGDVVKGETTLLSGLSLELDLSNSICADISHLCARVTKHSQAMPSFHLNPALGRTRCVPVACAGAEIEQLQLTLPSTAPLLEVLQNDVEAVISFSAKRNRAGISDVGSQLIWTFSLFVSDTPDGSGERGPVSVLNQPGTIVSGEGLNYMLTFPLDLFNYVCGGPEVHLCVELGPGPHANLDLTVSYPPVRCAPIGCRGAAFGSLTVDLGTSIFLEYTPDHSVTFNLSATTDANATTIESRNNARSQVTANLWTVSLTGDDQSSGAMHSEASTFYTSSRGDLTVEQARAPYEGGMNLRIGAAGARFNLSDFYCPEGDFYVCVTLDRNPSSSPNFTLESTAGQCQIVPCTGVVIDGMVVEFSSGVYIRERSQSQPVMFDLKVTSDSAGSPAVGSSLWSVRTYLTNTEDGSGNSSLGEAVAALTPTQRGMDILSGDTAIFQNVQTLMDLRSLVSCAQVWYFCAELMKDSNPSRPFRLEGRLISCTRINCRGVLIVGRTAAQPVNSRLLLREGRQSLVPVLIHVTYTADPEGASVEGTNLWLVYVFASGQPDVSASSTLYGNTVGMLPPNGQNFALYAGRSLSFLPVTANLSFAGTSRYLVCSDIQYVCARLERHPISPVQFSLQAEPEFAATACARYECTGVVVSRTTLNPTSPLSVMEGGQFEVTFDIDLDMDFTSSVLNEGRDHWRVVVFANGNSDGLGQRTPQTEVSIPPNVGERGAEPGVQTRLLGLSAVLDFTGLSCGTLQFICVEVSVPVNSEPPFRLNGLNENPDRLIGCQPTNCIGVRVTGGTLTVPTGSGLIEGLANQNLMLDIIYNTDTSGAGALGENLWQLEVFIATDDSGSNPFGSVTANLAGGFGNQGVEAGSVINFAQTVAVLNTLSLLCFDSSHICATLGKGSSQTFSLNGYVPGQNRFDDGLLTTCAPISCSGVHVDETIVTINEPTGAIYAREDNQFHFNVTFNFAVNGGSVTGYDLWDMEAFMSQSESGSPETQASRTPVVLTGDQRNTLAVNGVPSTFSDLWVNLSLANFNCPSGFGYLCARISPSALSMPSFSLSGNVVGCGQVPCAGITIVSSSIIMTSPETVKEHEDSQFIYLDLYLTVALESADFDVPQSLWSSLRVYTSKSNRSPDGTVDTTVSFQTQQARTALFRGEVSVITDIFVRDFGTTNAQCQDIPFVCVTLANSPLFSVTFMQGSETACVQLPCRGVEIIEVNLAQLLSSTNIYERMPSVIVSLDAEVESNVDGSGISGNNLWKIEAFFDDRQDCRGNFYPETRSPVLPVGYTNLPIVAGQTLILEGSTFANMNLANLLCPDGPLYLCIEFDKQQTPNPPFSLTFVPDDSVKYSSVEMTCTGVLISYSIGSFSSGLMVTEGDASHDFKLNVFSYVHVASAVIEGTSLWDLTIYGSRDAGGLGNQEFLTSIPLSPVSRNQVAAGSTSLSFPNLDVSVNLRGIRCAHYPYICVRINRDIGSIPPFTIAGTPDQSSLIVCQSLMCAGIIIDSFVAGITTGSVIYENRAGQAVGTTLTIQSSPSAPPALQNNYWRAFVFFNDQLDGTGPAGRIAETEMMIDAEDRTSNLSSGGILSLAPATGTVDFLTSCRTGEYMCFEIFNGMDLLAPAHTLLGTVIHCYDVQCMGLVVTGTNLVLRTGLSLQEGVSEHTVSFNVAVVSALDGADATVQPDWEVRAFLSSTDYSGTTNEGILPGSVIENVLPVGQRARPFVAGSTVTFEGVLATFSTENLLCASIRYVCVEFGTPPGGRHTLTPENGDAAVLTDCQELTCTGLRVTASNLLLRDGQPLISNEINHVLSLSFEFAVSQDSVAFTGRRLFAFSVFPNSAPSGDGITPLDTSIMLFLNQSLTIQPGAYVTFDPLLVSITLRGIRCEEMPYICGTLMKGASPSPRYTLQPDVGDPVLTSCTAQLSCIGVQVTQLVVEILSGFPIPEDASSHEIQTMITLSADPDGGSAEGQDLWAARMYMSSSADGGGDRFFETTASLGTDASTALRAGETVELLSSASFSLDGFSCAATRFVCLEFSKSTLAVPDFTFEAHPNFADGFVICKEFVCRAVKFSSVSFDVDPNQGSPNAGFRVYEFDPEFQIILNVRVSVAPDSVPVSGSNLWQVIVFFSDSADGTGPRLGEATANLTAEQGQVPIDPNEISALTGVLTTADLSSVSCRQLSHVCTEVWKGPAASPQYGIDTPASQAQLRQCLPVVCTGVEIVSVNPVLGAGTQPLFDRTALTQTISFDLEIYGNPFAAGINGAGLWQVEVYISDSDVFGLGDNLRVSPDPATLPSSEADKSFITSQTLSLDGLSANFVLNSVDCGVISFLCATLQKGNASNPDFSLLPQNGQQSRLTGCIAVECINVAITQTTMVHGPPSVLEGDPSHTISMNITSQLNRFGRIITTNPLWQFTVFASDGAPGEELSRVVVSADQLTTAQRNRDFIPGMVVAFTDVRATLNLQDLTCRNFSYFCVRVGFVQPILLVGLPNPSTLEACSSVASCGEFTVDLDVLDFGEQTIDISWGGGVGDFDHYEITYSPENGVTESPLTITRYNSQRTLTFERLTPGQEYVITIQLKRGSVVKDGMRSVVQTTRPEQIAGLILVDVGPQAIEVTWDGAGGIFDHYQLMLDPSDGNPASPVRIQPGTTREQFINLVIATRYTVTIITQSGGQSSSPSQVTGFTTPTSPTLRFRESTTTEIIVRWSAPSGYSPSRYEIIYNSTFSNQRIIPSVSSGLRSYNVTGLTPGTKYFLYLVAIVDDGAGVVVRSPPSLAIGDTGPDTPTVENIVPNVTTICLDLSLDRGSAHNYVIEYRALTSNTRSRVEIPVSLSSTPYCIQDLQSATSYTIVIVSIFSGVSSDERMLTIQTVVEAPTNLRIQSVSPTSIGCSWQHSDGKRDGYRVAASYPSGEEISVTEANSFTFDALPSYTHIDITVETMYMVDGNIILSLPLAKTQRTDGALPGPILNAQAVQVEDTTEILLTFDIPQEVNGELQSFIVTYVENREGAPQPAVTNVITVLSQIVTQYTHSFGASNFIRGSAVVFTIRARNDAGLGPIVTTNEVLLSKLAPALIPGVPLTNVADVATSETLTVKFTRTAFSRDAQGPLTYTLIIAQKGQFVEDIETTETLDSVIVSPQGPYQAFNPKLWPVDEPSILVEIGTEQLCGSFTYCNPPLEPDTTYLVAIRVYNEAGFTTSDFIEIKTPPTLFEVLSANLAYNIIGGVALLLILLFLVILCCCCCRCKSKDDLIPRKRSSRPRKRISSYDGNSSDGMDGADNFNLNNAVTLIYSPEDRISSAASLASHLEGGTITRPVPLQNFAAHVGRLGANSQEGFQVEFESLQDCGVGQSTSAALTSENKSKNRFSNIVPYDTTRVVLHGDDNYINASFIAGFHNANEFIATQGPMEHTANDFWRMVWEQRVPIVVMICDIVEGGKTKCDQYWPTLGEPTAYGGIRLTMLTEKQTSMGKEREFQLEIGESSHTVKHFQFLEWPDKGVPSDTSPFMLFVKDMRSQMKPMSGPVVVHCSDGASRTGVFIALDILTQALDAKADTVDVYGSVTRLRNQRINMVLSKHYYVFLHQSVMDVLIANVSDSNWTFRPSASVHELVALDDDDHSLLGTESSL